MEKFSSQRIFLLLFAGTFAVLLLARLPFYFANPIHEHGDIALNALQIERAKAFRELYGNYSRFHFNHPGPAFFYVYAFADHVLRVWLGIDITPHNAHSLAGLAIQSFFFSLALSLAASWVRYRMFLPLALLAGALHFSLVGSAFVSIWPPHVLLMPFLAFFIACQSVASGRISHLPWAALAGCFLVHGHVAQPLFVVTLFLGSCVVFWRNQRREPLVPPPWRSNVSALVLAGSVILLFVFPIILDLLKGAESNFSDILRHLRYSGEEQKSTVKAVLYFLSFLGYVENQEAFLGSLRWDTFRMFLGNPAAMLVWTGLLILMVRRLLSQSGPVQGEPHRWLKQGGILYLFTVILCVVWGTQQTGPMFAFNGYFFHAVNFAAAIIVCAMVAAWLEDRRCHSLWAVGACALAAIVAGRGFHADGVTEAESGLPYLQTARDAIARDPRPDLPKLLAFEHDDWPVIASIALALQRAGVKYYVDASWEFMFQADRVVPSDLLRAATPPLSVWRFSRNPEAASSVRFKDGLRIIQAPAELSPTNGLIDFRTGGNLSLYLATGFSTPDNGSAWTNLPDVLLQFRPSPAEQDVEVEIVAEPFLPKGKIEMQPTELRFNGQLLFSAPFTEPGVLRVRILRELWNQYPIASLHLHLPNARSPSELGLSGDVRAFSLQVRRLVTKAALPLSR